MPTRLQLLKDRHAGERCVIVANGPSLNKMDLSFLPDETSIAMNKIFLGFESLGFYPNYYVAVNRKVIEQSVDQINAINCVKFISNFNGQSYLTESGLTYFVNTANPPARFCTDLSQGMHEGWTVTHAALQIAYYLGFVEVIIIGMDHRFEFHGRPNEAQKMIGSDPNHFHPDYFADGQLWDNPDLEHSEESYRAARKAYEADGRRIIDATVNGACEIFEKADYRQIFGV